MSVAAARAPLTRGKDTPPARIARGTPPFAPACGSLPTDIYLALRLSMLGFSSLLPLVGAASAGGVADAAGVLLGVAFAFHVYAYLLNDVVDLDVDRCTPGRAEFPLVRGALSARAVLAIAAAQPAAALALVVRLDAGQRSYAALAAAFAALTLYDLFGKRCRVPLASDFVQGVGWAALLAFGACAIGEPTMQTAWLAVAVVAYVMLVNGVHGGLRDLAADAACGARTTALWFGARPGSGSSPVVPRALVAHCLVLHVIMFAALLGALGPPHRTAAVCALASFALAAGVLLLVMRSGRPITVQSSATAHLFLCMGALTVPVLPALGASTWPWLVGAYLLPIAALLTYRSRAR